MVQVPPPNPETRRPRTAPPISERRVVLEMLDLLATAALLVVVVAMMAYALWVGRDDPRHFVGLLWGAVLCVLLAGFVGWRRHILINRKD